MVPSTSARVMNNLLPGPVGRQPFPYHPSHISAFRYNETACGKKGYTGEVKIIDLGILASRMEINPGLTVEMAEGTEDRKAPKL